MSDLFDEPENATPLDPDERAGLKPSWITHRRDLNAAERDNILKGAIWARRSRRKTPDFLSDTFARLLHKRMFGDVWDWAGLYRTTGRNIGIDATLIFVEMISMFDDARYQVACNVFAPDEIAVRLHHRLVAIHPFPNGNGRHARLMADVFIERLGGEAFSWGGANLTDAGQLRAHYIAALRAADRHDITPLMKFARG